MRVHYLVSDNGDGSSSVQFFRSYEKAAALLDNEYYYANEGEVGSFEIPDGPNSIRFSDNDGDDLTS